MKIKIKKIDLNFFKEMKFGKIIFYTIAFFKEQILTLNNESKERLYR